VKPIVAVVGRPNVGKSTLFNRIIQKRLAIVESESGITRDRLYADSEWEGRSFVIVDTGGIDLSVDDVMAPHIRKQAEMAVAEAHVIIFVVDGRAGITSGDIDVAEVLRRSDKPVILAVNKMDTHERSMDMYEFYALGFDKCVPISAAHGLNVGDLLDEVVAFFPDVENEEAVDDDRIRISVIGRPNVGKSSLINALLGEDRMIVSDIPGTTRDAIDSVVEHNGAELVFIDTAGMRRKSKVDPTVERYSVLRALRAIDRSDIVLLVLDASQEIAEQDQRIAGYAHEAGKAAIIVMNKWDLVEKDPKIAETYRAKAKQNLAFMSYAPVVFVSAKTGLRVGKILDLIEKTAHQYFMRLSTPVLNDLIREALGVNPPPTDKGKRLKILYATQTGVKPPTFVFFVNDPELVHFSYRRYLENKLRESFGFEGTPLRLIMRKRE